ncbi:hypothetical protein DRJ17_07420, partial [Candidatus Woesearchaeota archaeon]
MEIQTKKILNWTLILLALTNLFILFNIPVLQQVFGFIVFSIIPGLLILFWFKQENPDFWKFLVYSTGLSISFLMLGGILINQLLHSLGIPNPLAPVYLVACLDLLILGIWKITYDKNKDNIIFLQKHGFPSKSKVLFAIPFLFPILAILGARHLDSAGQSIIPMLLITVMSIYALALAVFYRRWNISKNVFALAIFMIALSLLFMVSLRSGHIFGCDVHGEYFVYQLTKDNLHWEPNVYSYNPCLSITLLPVVYNSITGIAGEQIFTILFQVLFALCPLIIFLMMRRYTSSLYAFLSALFFSSIEIFSLFVTIARNEIALLFFVLSLLVFFDNALTKASKKTFFIIFGIMLILSHYTVSYIYVGLLISMIIANLVSEKITKYRSSALI